MRQHSSTYDPLKRFLDCLFAVAGLFVLAPLFGLTALAVRVWLGSPVLFRQQRPGLYGKPFVMLKFRSMTEGCDPNCALLPDAARLTRAGRFLRAVSLDEIPQLWNILRGDMSFVGPRPLLMHYLPAYTPHHFRRHEVRPGLTGWAQVKGRNRRSWEDRFAMDVWYVDNRSLKLDLWIILRSFWVVLAARDITEKGGATMTAFVAKDTDSQESGKP